MMQKKSQISLLILGLFITLGVVVGVSYALWQVTLMQSGSNILTSDCFQIEFSDLNPIHLDKAFPITNEEGEALTPYEFTITNTCNTRANYQINLEILNNTTFTRLEYIREKLNEKGVSSGSRILTRNTLVEKTLENAKEAYKLNQGVLEAKESKTYEFRFWMDEATPAIPEVMNKALNTKVTVVTSLKRPVDRTNMMMPMDIEETCGEYEGEQWCIPVKNNTYTQGEKYESTLKKVIFESTKNPIEGSLEVKDFSVNQDESVLGYYVGNEYNTEVTLHIQADGKIKVNENGSYYFSVVDGTPIYTFEGFENLDTSEVTDMSYMFYNMNRLTSLDLNNFDTSNVVDMCGMFMNMSDLGSLNLKYFDTRNVTDMGAMFYGVSSLTSLDLGNFDTLSVTSMDSMFFSMSSLTSLDVSHFDTSNVKSMNRMFALMTSLPYLDVSSFDTSNVTDMSEMFSGMSSLTNLDLSHFDTRNVTDMSSMFSIMTSLINLDLSHFDTRNVTDMSAMFSVVNSLTNLDLSHFDTSNVTDMNRMFVGMSSLNHLNLNHFDTSKVTDMSSMFSGMSSLNHLNLSHFDTSNVTNMGGMFDESNNLTTILYGDKFVRKVNSNITDMFSNCPANKPTGSSWNGAF